MSSNGILPMSMSATATAGNDRPLGSKKRARGADRSPAPAPLSPRNASDRAAAWHASLVDSGDESARPSKRMLRQVEFLLSASSKDATTGRAAPSRARAPTPASTEASTTSASATASGGASTFVLDSDPTSAFTTSSPCGLRCGADARTPLPRPSSATGTCDALNARTAARTLSTRAVVAPDLQIAQRREKEEEDKQEEVGGARAQAAPRTPRPQLSVDFDPLDEQRKLMRDFGRAKAASPECKLPRSVTPQAVDEALQEEDEEEDEEEEEWYAEGQEQQHAQEEDEELDQRHAPALRYQTLMGTHDRAASTAGAHYFEMLIEQPSALMLVGVARPKLRNEFDSRTAGAGASADADAPGSAGEGAGAGAAARPSTPVANTSRSAAQQEQSPLKAFRSQHAFQLHTATGDRWHAGRPCAPSPTLEPEPAPAAPTSNSAAPVRRCLGVTAGAVQGSGNVAGMTAKELEILDEAGLLAEPEPRFQKGDRVGVLVEIDANAPGTSACGGAGEGAAKAKRARVSFTRNGRTLRKVGAFEDIAVEDGFVPVVDVALGGRVRFVDWKHFV